MPYTHLPQHIDLEMVQGTDNSFTFRALDNSGASIDLTDYVIKMSVKDTVNGTTKIPTKTVNPIPEVEAPEDPEEDPEGQEAFLAYLSSLGIRASGYVTFDIDKDEIDETVNQDDITCWVYEIRLISSVETVNIQGLFKVRPAVGV
jgi:hypothetical protein